MAAIPFVIDNRDHKLADVLAELLAAGAGCPLDVATAYFAISGYRLVREGLHKLGAMRLLIGSEPASGSDLGLRPDERTALAARLQGDLDAEPFTAETLKLVEELIAFIRSEKVEVRRFERGFLHAKAYLFHRDRVGPQNRGDRLRPFAAVVGSSNFTGPGLSSNRELNLVHRVLTPDEAAVDADAAEKVAYLGQGYRLQVTGDSRREADIADAQISDANVSDAGRRLIKSEVGARAVSDLAAWFERHWAEAVDFKQELVELLDASKFGAKQYTPFEVYIKALFEYFRDELGDDAPELGRSAVELAEFQEDAVKKARRILARYDGVLVADSVGLGKTWIGKKLLEDFAYHRRQKAVVVCPASLRPMWQRELAAATIAATVVGMEELGREGFDTTTIGDADCILIDESHNFRNGKSNRYLALDEAIHRHGGRGRDGRRKKIILLSATPINNDIYDLANQIGLFTQGEADYFRDAGIGDLTAYFRRARRLTLQSDASAGVVLFNLLEEVMVRNTRPYIRAAYANATINGRIVVFPERRLHTVEYDLGATRGGLYAEIVAAIDGLSLGPYQLESYREKSAIRDEKEHEWEAGRETALVGIFKTRFLKRLESSIAAFRESVRRALVFEETYRDYLLDGTAVSSRDFHRLMRFVAQDEEDEPAAASVADSLDAIEQARAYLDGLKQVDRDAYDLRRLNHDVEQDVALLRKLYERTEPLAERDGKLERLKELLAGELVGKKVLIFSSYKDTSRYLHRELTSEANGAWRAAVGGPTIRRIDSGNHPDERGHLLGLFAPLANGREALPERQIDVLISTDVLSEGQNLQDCGVIINYDLTWNPIRLVQRNGRIDRIGSPHAEIGIYNLFPESELEDLLRLVDRLTARISAIDAFGLLDASILGEVVHPRTFNTLRRIRAEDGAVLDEEEARAELAGPELLLKQLKHVLGKGGSEPIAALPNGIHSGLRRDKCHGMFFYFQAPRATGDGKRHFWRYIDARTREVKENRYEIAQLIACQPDEPRYIGDQDVFALQEQVIEQILSADSAAEAKAAAPPVVDPIQQTLAEELKDALRRRTVDRELAKRAIRFLGQPMGRALHMKLKGLYETWTTARDDVALLAATVVMADEFGKERPSPTASVVLRRGNLTLVCFEYVSG
ncbi:MAG TPA: helicase-related protein [Pirellulales bacterium]|nr:helicase-related protein [Pirellulales bacterium]